MKTQRISYRLKRPINTFGKTFVAQREISFEIRLCAQLMMDQVVSKSNKANFDLKINDAIDTRNKELFKEIAENDQHYAWEY